MEVGREKERRPAKTGPTLSQKARKSDYIVAKEFRGSDPILSAKVFNEAREMSAVYPLLYVLENSIREFLRRVVDARLGKDWWTTTASRKIIDKIKDRMANEKKHAWHQHRGDHPVDYLDLDELSLVVQNNQALFCPEFLPTAQWFDQFLVELYQSRCVVCQMNPLEKDNIADVKLKLKKWQKHLEEKKDLLPTVVASNP